MTDKLKAIANEIADSCISSPAMKHMHIEAFDQTTEGYRILLESFEGSMIKKFLITIKEIK